MISIKLIFVTFISAIILFATLDTNIVIATGLVFVGLLSLLIVQVYTTVTDKS